MNFLLLFPFLRGLVKPHLAPLTYFLVAVNVLVFLTCYNSFEAADAKLDSFINDEAFLTTQGAVFGVMIREKPELFSSMLRKLEKQSLRGDGESRQLLGTLAMRNLEFMDRVDSYNFHGDEIAVKTWREKFLSMKRLQAKHPSYLWGVSQGHNGWINWLSYQFAHSGFSHLFWNMVFLIFFGVFVEVRLGSSFVILTYLGAGVVGVSSFIFLSGLSSSPLVGASAAISGLMGLVAFAFWDEKLKYFYWLLPVRGYYGFALLPSWLVVIVYALPDIAGYLGAIPELGSIAYTAHIGGTAFGFLVAALYKAGWLKNENEDDPDYIAYNEPYDKEMKALSRAQGSDDRKAS